MLQRRAPARQQQQATGDRRQCVAKHDDAGQPQRVGDTDNEPDGHRSKEQPVDHRVQGAPSRLGRSNRRAIAPSMTSLKPARNTTTANWSNLEGSTE